MFDVFTTSATGLKTLTAAIAQSKTLFNINNFSFNNDENEKINISNEYRDLLISLSGEKSDHILWIECLKQYEWKNNLDSEFSFELDKFGVPLLKVKKNNNKTFLNFKN